MDTKISYAFDLLSGTPLETLKSLSPNELRSIDEIHLRVNRPMSVSIGSEDRIIKDTPIKPEEIEFTFKSAFSYSMHSYSKELSGGYITTRGGNRVGICGTAVTASGESIETLKYISSVNIRIAREIKGAADGIVSRCFNDGLCGVLIIGPPSSGKTTVLRDLVRQLGNRMKVSLIDELNEISATHRNVAQNDVGRLTDVFVSRGDIRGGQGDVTESGRRRRNRHRQRRRRFGICLSFRSLLDNRRTRKRARSRAPKTGG